MDVYEAILVFLTWWSFLHISYDVKVGFLLNKILLRKLSERPSAEELEQRNILKAKDGSISSKKAMEETKRMLLRKVPDFFIKFLQSFIY